MKTRFEINQEVFMHNGSLEDCYKYYYKHFEKYGYILDKKEESVYIEYDTEYNLKEGDRVSIPAVGYKIIEWKCFDIDEQIIRYSVVDE